nr:radical SAM protein [Nocardia vinacea]
MAEGARVTPSAESALVHSKMPLRTRSGVSGGLDLQIADGIDVNVPVSEMFVRMSPYTIDHDGNTFVVMRGEDSICNANPLPLPSYYELRTADDTEAMHRIAQMCSADRLCFGMTGPTCHFWRRDRRCQYCSIGKNFSADAARKQQRHLLEVLDASLVDNRLPARHLLIGGGTPSGPDMGAILASELCRSVKERHDIQIYVMIAAPIDNSYIDMLKDAGADELGMNLEFWSDEAWQKYIPGKNDLIGKNRYLSALEHAVEKFGPINTRSILIAGLEDASYTREAAAFLAGLGVMPIVSPFRSLDGTMLQDSRGFKGDKYVKLWSAIESDLAGTGIPLGPVCVPCQNNTLAIPNPTHIAPVLVKR